MRRTETCRWTAAAALVGFLLLSSPVTPLARADPDGARPRYTITVEGGIRATTLGIDAQLQTPIGLVVGAGPGSRFGAESTGFSVNAYVGYHLPLGAHWAFRPAVRASRLWWKTDRCSPPSCTYDFLLVEAGLRHRSQGGFVFDFGLPLFALVPVSSTTGEMGNHLTPYSLATPGVALLSSLMFGFDW